MPKTEESRTVLQKTQSCCLGIVEDIDRVCRKYGIHYSLCAGSVIGAMLYHGFVPWDDDMDLMMTRKDYDRFLRIYPEKCSSRYHLRHYTTDGAVNLPALFARVEDIRTETVEEIAGGLRKGRVFVDITVFDDMPGKICHHLLRLYTGYTYTFLYRMNGMTPGTGWKKRLFSLLPSGVSGERLSDRYRRLERICRSFSKKRHRFCAEVLSAAFGNIMYERRIFDFYTEVPFEGRSLMVVRDYRDYLFMRYGRRKFSREVPEEKRQKSHILSVRMEP